MTTGSDRSHFGFTVIALVGALLFVGSDLFSQGRSGSPLPQSTPKQPATQVQQGVGRSPIATTSYETLFEQARKQLESKQPRQAQTTAESAIRLDGERYEAHIIAAAALRDQKQYAPALAHVQTALALAPENNKSEIQRALIGVRVLALAPDSRRKLDALMLVMNDADSASSSSERTKLLREFMIRSTAFLADYPFVADLWLLRAAAALELDYPEMGWIAKYQLDQLGMGDTDDPAFRRVMAQMERKQWLGKLEFPLYYSEIGGWSQAQWAAKTMEARDGNVRAQFVMGQAMLTGIQSGTRDGAQAVMWFRKAAEQGSAVAVDALYVLSAGFEPGASQDLLEAGRWVLTAARLGLPAAQATAGELLMSDSDFFSKSNPAEGLRWLRKAAAQSDVRAEMKLGDAYRHGKGLKPDTQEAMRWYHTAGQHALKQDDLEGTVTLDKLTRLFSTDPDPAFRDGSAAVTLALTLIKRWHEDEVTMVTLAAAYAEAADWANALATQQKALELLKNSKPGDETARIEEYQERLQLYQNKQPYRERKPVR